MSTHRAETDPSEGVSLPQHSRMDPMPHAFVQLADHPELIPVITQAVDDVLKSSHLDRERNAGLVESVEWAAAAAALTAYQRMAISALRVGDAAEHSRRATADAVAATAEVIADRVTNAAAEIHTIDDASAAHLALIAARAATELAGSIGAEEDEIAASVAAALVVKAVSDAAAVTASARAGAATSLAQAAADAATNAAQVAASTAWAAQLDLIGEASDHQKNALETCYKVAAATAQAVITQATQSTSAPPVR